MHIRSYFWLLPFCSFFTGYYIANRWWHKPSIPAPALIGLELNHAVKIISDLHLYPKLLEERLDSDTPAGTIIQQIPAAATPVKPGQTICLVITKQPQLIQAPTYSGMHKTAVENHAATAGIRLRTYILPSNYPSGTCIGQWPSPETPLEGSKMIVYYAAADPKAVLIPDMRGLSVSEVQELCLKYGLPAPIIHTKNTNQASPRSTITDQRPLPGAILAPSQIVFHLQAP